MPNTALTEFKSLASNTAKTDVLVEAVRDSFAIISPWARATSANRAVQEFIQSLREEAKSFFGSVAQSWKNAQGGYSFAKRATDLCGNLLKPEISDEEIQASITKMREIAQKAHEEATTTSNMFRSNRQGLHCVVATIHGIKESMHSDHKKEGVDKKKAERKAEALGDRIEKLLPIGKKRKRKNNKKLRLYESPVKGIDQDHGRIINPSNETNEDSEASRNPLHVAAALLSLPITLPLVIVAKNRQAALEAQAEEIESRIVTIESEIKNFEKVTERLGDLAAKMGTMADYWFAMDATLEDMHGRVDDLRNDITLRIEIKGLASDWYRVGLDYFDYKKQLAMLKDTSPEIQAIMEGKTELPAGPIHRNSDGITVAIL